MKCPRCLRSNSYVRLKTQESVCRQCGLVWSFDQNDVGRADVKKKDKR